MQSMNKRAMPRGRRRHRQIVDDVLLGILFSGGFALVLCLWVTLIFVVAGEEPFESNSTTWGTVVGVYLLGGIIVGVLWGIAKPWIRNRVGSAVFGFFAAVPIFLAIALTTGGFDLLGVVVCSALLGPALGWRFWGIFEGSD